MSRPLPIGSRVPINRFARPHDLDSETCWCNPIILHDCPECEIVPAGGTVTVRRKDDGSIDIDAGDARGCWRCGGTSVIACPEPDPATCDEEHILIHQQPDELDAST